MNVGKPWHVTGSNYFVTYDWLNVFYSVNNARYVQGEGWTYQLELCSTGGAQPNHNYHLWFTGNAMLIQRTYDDKIGQKWGVDSTCHGGQSLTIGFSLATSWANVNGSDTFTCPGSGNDRGDIGNDGKFLAFPSRWDSYWRNRTNTYYISPHNFPMDGSVGYQGQVGHVLYEFPMSTGTIILSDYTL